MTGSNTKRESIKMITIEINGSRHECETERDACRLMAREMRKAKKADRERAGKLEAARLKANAKGYRLLCAAAECAAEAGKRFPRGWVCYKPGDEWLRHLVVAHEEERYTWRINTEEGQAEIRFYSHQLVGAVCNGSGYCWVVFLREEGGERETRAMTVAVHDGEAAWAYCPGITMEMFRGSKEERAEMAEAVA